MGVGDRDHKYKCLLLALCNIIRNPLWKVFKLVALSVFLNHSIMHYRSVINKNGEQRLGWQVVSCVCPPPDLFLFFWLFHLSGSFLEWRVWPLTFWKRAAEHMVENSGLKQHIKMYNCRIRLLSETFIQLLTFTITGCFLTFAVALLKREKLMIRY